MQSADNDPSRGHTILFADDDPFLRELVSLRLRSNRYDVIEAANGHEALPVLQARLIDVLLTDISMPGPLDGWSLAERAREIHAEIAVIYLSSGRPEPSRQVSGSLYLRKPSDSDAILSAVRQVMSLRNGDSARG